MRNYAKTLRRGSLYTAVAWNYARSLPLRAAQPALNHLTPGNGQHPDVMSPACPLASDRQLQRRHSFTSSESLEPRFRLLL